MGFVSVVRVTRCNVMAVVQRKRMKYKNLLRGWLLTVAAGSVEVYSSEAHPSHETHVHGAAVLNIVLGSKLTLLIGLESLRLT